MMANNEEEVGRKYCIYGRCKKDSNILVVKVKGRNHAQDTGVNERIILK
jgi:hypothetical protein